MKTLWQKIKCFFGYHDNEIDRCYTSLDYERDTGTKAAFNFADIERHCKACGNKESGWIF